MAALVVSSIVIGVILISVVMYNKLVRLKMAAEESLAQVDVQLARRFDLIPNLVETVKGYASHERETLESVVAARSQTLAANTVAEKAAADGALAGALRGLFALAEAYPDLKASGNFMALQEELAATENKIGFARQRYNDQVRALNTALETIPGRFYAPLTKAVRAEYFEADPDAQTVPRVQF
jgi:LemA protein